MYYFLNKFPSDSWDYQINHLMLNVFFDHHSKRNKKIFRLDLHFRPQDTHNKRVKK